MANTASMMQALTAALNTGETLLHPVFGIEGEGNFQQYGYFAFTETHFIVVYLSGKRVSHTERIPLNVKSIKIRKTKLFGQYIIAIRFGKKRTVSLTLAPKVLTIDTQKENLPLFIAHLRSIAKAEAVALADMPGEKIRWQYFNTYLYMQFAFLPMVPLIILISEFKEGNFAVGEVVAGFLDALPVLLVMYAFFFGPFLILSVLNRFFFGKVVAVVRDGTVFFENNEEIAASNIREIVYHPRVASRTKIAFSYATLFTQQDADEAEPINILHFPIYGMQKIKRHNPAIKLRIDKSVWFYVLLPSVVGIVMSLLIG